MYATMGWKKDKYDGLEPPKILKYHIISNNCNILCLPKLAFIFIHE